MIVAIDCGRIAYGSANATGITKLKAEGIEVCLADEIGPHEVEFIDEHDTVVAAFILQGGRLLRQD